MRAGAQDHATAASARAVAAIIGDRMRSALIRLSIGATLIAVAACARDARLYPVNNAASATGVLRAHYKAYGTGHGELEITMPDGEVLSGEYSLVRGGAIGFGSIIAAAQGSGGSATGYATTSSYVIPGGSPGTAAVVGPKGTSMQCEFYNDNFSGHGYGACRSSDGALYRLLY